MKKLFELFNDVKKYLQYILKLLFVFYSRYKVMDLPSRQSIMSSARYNPVLCFN